MSRDDGVAVPIPLATRRAEGKTPRKRTPEVVPVRVRDPDRVERVERLISIRPERSQRAGAAVEEDGRGRPLYYDRGLAAPRRGLRRARAEEGEERALSIIVGRRRRLLRGNQPLSSLC